MAWRPAQGVAALSRAGTPIITMVAAGGCVAGLLAAVPHFPSPVSGLLLGLFVATGPGGALLAWGAGLSRAAALVLVPVTGVAVVILATTIAVSLSWWQPRALLIGMAVSAGASVLVRWKATNETAPRAPYDEVVA